VNRDRVDFAVADAQRFLNRTSELKTMYPRHGKEETDFPSGKEAAAVKRASLDLSRSLAAMRRSA